MVLKKNIYLFAFCIMSVSALAVDIFSPFASANEKAMQPTGQPPRCLIKTSLGDIEVALFADEAPETVENFISLAEGRKTFTDAATGKKVRRPFYDGLVFHRVIKNFMIQGGCPNGNGTGGPGYTFKDEINADALGLNTMKAVQPDGAPHPYLMIRSQNDFSRIIVTPIARKLGIRDTAEFEKRKAEVQEHISRLSVKACYEMMGYQYITGNPSHKPLRGFLAMANSGPNTNGSQFFINLVDTPWLTGKHTVFGKVVKGMSVVDKIGDVTVDGRSKPIKDITIISIRSLKPPEKAK